MLKHFDEFTAVANITTEYFRTLSSAPITIIPNGIDITKYQKPKSKKAKDEMKTILYVGRLEKRKGVRFLIKAFSELAIRRDDVELVIGGTGVDDASLHDFVEMNGIPRVKFLGYLEEEYKIELLNKADVFCAPSTYGESFGIVLVEAMAARTPIVAGDNPGYSELLSGKGALSLVNPKDSLDFSRRLELFLFDEDLRQLWLEWSNQYVKQFDWPIITDHYLEVYENAINKHK
jgi:phosphatidylinositol alpha-mannosyltransferase